MATIFVILIVVVSVILGLIILIQNPKGGGLSSSFGGVGTQLMGVKQTTDALEKGTWLFSAILGVLCLTSAMFISGGSGGSGVDQYYDAPAGNPATPQNTTTPPFQSPSTNSAAPDTNK